MPFIIAPELFPDLQFISLFLKDTVHMDLSGSFERNTARNRYRIIGPNGIQELIVPVKKSRKALPIKEVHIEYQHDWQRNHWQSLQSAYGKSPFFDYYKADIQALMMVCHGRLVDLSIGSIQLCLRLLRIPQERLRIWEGQIGATNSFATVDWNEEERLSSIQHLRYLQVWQERHGFVHGLSIVDLLFNEGPNALLILKKLTEK